MKKQTMQQKVLLDLLNNTDDWRSGDAIAANLGVTRETVWKTIKALRTAGHVIDGRKSQGYRYEMGTELNADAIAFYSARDTPLIVQDEMRSTQLEAKAWLTENTLTAPTVLIANRQTRGYGRRGRQFYSPADSGLYMSLILPNVYKDIADVGLLTTGVATKVVQVLNAFFPDKPFSLKWVNDVLLDGRKVAGILCEAVMELESSTVSAFVVGVGLNLTTGAFPDEIAQKAGAIVTETPVDRNRLAAHLMDEIVTAYPNFPSGDFLPDYRKWTMMIGKTVTLDLGARNMTGQVQAIADNGGLVVRDAMGRTQTYLSGEVTKVNF